MLSETSFEALRAPETGLVLVRARIGGDGDRFNVGEATVTRCAVRHRARPGATVAGVGARARAGRRPARRVACVDALLQREDVAPAACAQRVHRWRPTRQSANAERAAAEATRVRFFTLQPEAA